MNSSNRADRPDRGRRRFLALAAGFVAALPLAPARAGRRPGDHLAMREAQFYRRQDPRSTMNKAG
ncbi:MAG TPA: hypothetical protein ENK50_01555 [Sedimenticola sp.]|nr:hypothetical protein [Sedimenticola sp.]